MDGVDLSVILMAERANEQAAEVVSTQEFEHLAHEESLLVTRWAYRLQSYDMVLARLAHLLRRKDDILVAAGAMVMGCWLFACFWTSTRTVLNQLCLVAAVFPALQYINCLMRRGGDISTPEFTQLCQRLARCETVLRTQMSFYAFQRANAPLKVGGLWRTNKV